MICSIHQPQSFPWLGFFAKIYQSDVFILLDNVQFKKNEFQNRNKIKMNDEARWLTVPVKHNFGQLINEIEINNTSNWKDKHLKTFQNFYSKSLFFTDYYPEIEKLYARPHVHLSNFNIEFINWSLEKLNIKTKIFIASKIVTAEEFINESATDKLIHLIKKTHCDRYLSGRGGKNYLEEKKMSENGIEILYQTFVHPEYKQLGKEFIPYLSILDLFFNEGPNSLSVLLEGIK